MPQAMSLYPGGGVGQESLQDPVVQTDQPCFRDLCSWQGACADLSSHLCMFVAF